MVDSPSSSRARRARARMLQELRTTGGSTRAGLAASLELAPSAVAATAAALIKDGFIAETGREGAGRTGPGRRPVVLVPVSRAARVLGLDIGHRHVAAAIANEAAEVLVEVREPADVDQHREATLELAHSLIRAVSAQAGLAVEDLDAVSACIPSTLTSTAAQQGPVALGAELQSRLGRFVTVINDADAGLLGELRFGTLTGIDDAIYVKVAHGVGAAFQLAGRPYRGSSGLSGEIGHIQPGGAGTAEPGTAWCRCGNQGCLETAISASSIDDRLGRVQGTSVSAGPGLDTVTQRMLMESGRILGRTLADLCTALNPAVVVIGGELATRVDQEGRSPLVLGVAESIERFALPAIVTHLQVRPALLANRAELLGVLSLALDAAARMTEPSRV